MATAAATKRADSVNQAKGKSNQNGKEPAPPKPVKMEFGAIAKKTKQHLVFAYGRLLPPVVGIHCLCGLIVAQNIFSVDKAVGKMGDPLPAPAIAGFKKQGARKLVRLIPSRFRGDGSSERTLVL